MQSMTEVSHKILFGLCFWNSPQQFLEIARIQRQEPPTPWAMLFIFYVISICKIYVEIFLTFLTFWTKIIYLCKNSGNRKFRIGYATQFTYAKWVNFCEDWNLFVLDLFVYDPSKKLIFFIKLLNKNVNK